MATFIAIVTFLGGSFFGVLVKELIGYISKRQDFKREKFKLLFQRKIEVAEKTVAYLGTAISATQYMKNAYEVTTKAIQQFEERSFDLTGLLANLHLNEEVLLNLSGEKYMEVRSADLYFDFSSADLWKEGDMLLLSEAAVEAKTLDGQIEVATKNYLLFVDNGKNEIADRYWAELKELISKYTLQMKRICDLLDQNMLSMKNGIIMIKEQLPQLHLLK